MSFSIDKLRTLLELQLSVCDALAVSETLRQGRCRAFAEDSLDASLAPEPALHAGDGGISLVVRTPEAKTSGALPAARGLPLAATLSIDAIEVPAIRRASAGSFTAMRAAEEVAHLLHDGTRITFDRFEGDLVRDGETRYYIFTAVFTVHFTHTPKIDE